MSGSLSELPDLAGLEISLYRVVELAVATTSRANRQVERCNDPPGCSTGQCRMGFRHHTDACLQCLCSWR